MSRTAEELICEILNNEAMSAELMAAMSEPSKVAEFLKAYDCDTNVSEFIKMLDKTN
ncbi:MAG: hypothetical protein IK990_20840 [Ruminiclostridium sp.]|nr:hypothetical protein [Ruminiclostridium sp.]